MKDWYHRRKRRLRNQALRPRLFEILCVTRNYVIGLEVVLAQRRDCLRQCAVACTRTETGIRSDWPCLSDRKECWAWLLRSPCVYFPLPPGAARRCRLRFARTASKAAEAGASNFCGGVLALFTGNSLITSALEARRDAIWAKMLVPEGNATFARRSRRTSRKVSGRRNLPRFVNCWRKRKPNWAGKRRFGEADCEKPLGFASANSAIHFRGDQEMAGTKLQLRIVVVPRSHLVDLIEFA